jgi:hypothetical protein
VNIPVLLHEIARWAVPFLTVPADVKKRADSGLLTPADCRLIAGQLSDLGRSLAGKDHANEAARLGEETVKLVRLAQEDGELRECLQSLYEISGQQPRRACLQFFFSLASFRRTPH